MKKFTILLASLAVMASSVPAFAGKDRIITVGELPAVAQQFVQTHFKAVEVSYAKVDEELFDKDYKVVFVNGSKVEFAKDGAWKEVAASTARFPQPSFRSRSATMSPRTIPTARSRRSTATAATMKLNWTTAST